MSDPGDDLTEFWDLVHPPRETPQEPPEDPPEVGMFGSPLFCEHANECPNICPCPPRCYCKAYSCSGRRC